MIWELCRVWDWTSMRTHMKISPGLNFSLKQCRNAGIFFPFVTSRYVRFQTFFFFKLTRGSILFSVTHSRVPHFLKWNLNFYYAGREEKLSPQYWFHYLTVLIECLYLNLRKLNWSVSALFRHKPMAHLRDGLHTSYKPTLSPVRSSPVCRST